MRYPAYLLLSCAYTFCKDCASFLVYLIAAICHNDLKDEVRLEFPGNGRGIPKLSVGYKPC